MSAYSITEPNGYYNFQKMTKLNKFYSTTKKFSSRCNYKPFLSVKNISTQNLFSTQNNSITHNKIEKSNSLLNFSNKKLNSSLTSYIDSNNSTRNSSHISTKIKSKFDPSILDTHYISKPIRHNNKFSNLDMPKFNTFLGSKIKTKSFNFKTFDLINGRLLNNTCGNKSNINKSIKDLIIKNKLKHNFKNNISISDSMKILIHRVNKGNKRSFNIINKFNKRLIYDKRENIKEFNNYMNELQTNLNLAKSKSKNNNRLIYE